MVRFEKQRIGTVTFEAASVCDVNQDGILDIVCGGYWFEGPDFTKQHKICDVQAVDDYFDDFSDFPLDINGDGFPDIITGGWWGNTIRWRENPKTTSVPWREHIIAEVGNVERPCFHDIDGDGLVEIIPNCPGSPVMIFRLERDAEGKGTGKFHQKTVWQGPSGHGIGFGDINGDGRDDIILSGGWLEAPPDPYTQEWVFHPDFNLGSASCPILVYDVNNDGVNDLIVGQAHGYGLDWWEQRKDDAGKRIWVKHEIDPHRSQYHDMQLVDIDNDGELELITGKRYWAHCGHDPGETDPIGLYYFKINNGDFERFTIDYGDPKTASGTGIYFWVEDLDGNGWKDIVAPGKEGLYLFRNMGRT
ncbi:MAG TPA: VCBS repeat-containing protein [Candidatus Hydrogenedentes bacterium]|nr:VCBS repeat-containing protein [Candidatus Hydrogenedentota bacterium]HOL76655.1 VCBS repeat-containing protein [Candidatus Hydrogenedentota bacterium]HPO84488.1 VCBS repeat-containing protein [Candidatus Hydrogenedentota bacterium]